MKRFLDWITNNMSKADVLFTKRFAVIQIIIVDLIVGTLGMLGIIDCDTEFMFISGFIIYICIVVLLTVSMFLLYVTAVIHRKLFKKK